MSSVTVFYSFLCSFYISLGMFSFIIFLRKNYELKYLLFSISSLSLACITYVELMLVKSHSVSDWINTQFLGYIAVFFFLSSIILLTKIYFKVGNIVPVALLIMSRFLCLLVFTQFDYGINFVSPVFLENHLFFKENISIINAETNKWSRLESFTVFAILIYLTYTSVVMYKRKEYSDERKAILLSITISLGILIAGMQAMAIHEGLIRSPYIISIAFLPFILFIGYELLEDLFHSIKISELLREKEQQISHLARISMMGELSGPIAHELNQPLSSILANSQAARRFLNDKDFKKKEIVEIIDDIISENKRAVEIIKRMRILIYKDTRPKFKKVFMEKLIFDSIKVLKSTLIDNNIDYNVFIIDKNIIVFGDFIQLQQVFLNLILNAIDSLNNLEDESKRLVIQIKLSRDSNFVTLSVIDYGKGVNNVAKKDIFEPYVTNKSKGLGLGLSISKSIILAHKGKLKFRNLSTKGCNFFFTLPVK